VLTWLAVLCSTQLLTFTSSDRDSAAVYVQFGIRSARAFDHQKALDAYKRAHQIDPTNCSALWRIAEAYVNLGEEADEKVKQQYFFVAEKWARKAIEACPDTANAHFILAVAAGHLALRVSGGTKLKYSKVVKTEAEKTLALQPDHHGAHHLLGRWHAEMAGLSWVLKTAAKVIYGGLPPASYELAIEHFKRAIEIAPEWINHHRQLGEIYMKLKKWDLARQAFQKVLELPIQDHEDARHKARVRKLLEKIKNR